MILYRRTKITLLVFMLSSLLLLSKVSYSEDYAPVQLAGDIGFNDLLTSNSIHFSTVSSLNSYMDMIFQKKNNKLFLLSSREDRFGITRLDFDSTSETLSFDYFIDLHEKMEDCPRCAWQSGMAMDISENYLSVLHAGCSSSSPTFASSDIWLLDISDDFSSPTIVGYDNLWLRDDAIFAPFGIWGMAMTQNAQRNFLSTGPIEIGGDHEGFFLTYTYNPEDGMNFIEKRGFFYGNTPEMGFLNISPDNNHLYIESLILAGGSTTLGAIFELQTYTTPSLVLEEDGIPALHAQFDKTGRHLYRYQESGGQIHHWMRNDNPSSETFGYLDLVGDYKDPFKLPRYANSFILSQDQSYGCSYTWDKNENKTSVTVFNRNTQTGELEAVMGNYFNMGRPFQFVCPPRDNRIHILFYDPDDKSYEIYEFRYDQDPMALGIANAITGKTEASDFYDYNQDGQVSVADIITRLIQAGN